MLLPVKGDFANLCAVELHANAVREPGDALQSDFKHAVFLRRLIEMPNGERLIYKGSGDPNDVSSYILFTDALDELGGSIMLDGEGGILFDTDNPVSLEFDLYPEANLLLLGIPSSL